MLLVAALSVLTDVMFPPVTSCDSPGPPPSPCTPWDDHVHALASVYPGKAPGSTSGETSLDKRSQNHSKTIASFGPLAYGFGCRRCNSRRRIKPGAEEEGGNQAISRLRLLSVFILDRTYLLKSLGQPSGRGLSCFENGGRRALMWVVGVEHSYFSVDTD